MDYSDVQKRINKAAFHRQRAYMPDARVVFDVGAWLGQTVNGYRKLYPEAQIYAFEPSPIICDLLSEQYAGNDRVSVFRVALAEQEGMRALHIHHPTEETSLLRVTDEYRERGVMHTQDVWTTVTTLDLFCSRQAIGRIDVLKLDVQGAELLVLEGARDLFDEGRVGLVFAEMNFWEQYQGQCWWYEVGAWLAGYGFELRELAPQWRHGYVSHANGVFARGEA